MSYSIVTIPPFDRQLKALFKKYPSIKDDMKSLAKRLLDNPEAGKPLGKNCFKIRVAIHSKNKGKSGEARVITHFAIDNDIIYLLSIYDKSDKDSISDSEVAYLLSFIR